MIFDTFPLTSARAQDGIIARTQMIDEGWEGLCIYELSDRYDETI